MDIKGKINVAENIKIMGFLGKILYMEEILDANLMLLFIFFFEKKKRKKKTIINS